MGLDYSLCAILHRKDSRDLLKHLATILTPEYKERIAHLEWSPTVEESRETMIGTTEVDAFGIADLELVYSDTENNICFSLQIQLEREMESYLGDHRFECFDQPGPFGCMWTSIYAGAKYVLISMTAATSGMSRVLQDSKAIHDLWISFAQKAGAIVAYVDIEDDVAIQLYPFPYDLYLPNYYTLSFKEDDRASVDLFAEFIRNDNEL